MRHLLACVVSLLCACAPGSLGRVCTSTADCGDGLSCIQVGEDRLADGGGAVLSTCTKECSSASQCTTRDSKGAQRSGFCQAPLTNNGKTYCVYSPLVD